MIDCILQSAPFRALRHNTIVWKIFGAVAETGSYLRSSPVIYGVDTLFILISVAIRMIQSGGDPCSAIHDVSTARFADDNGARRSWKTNFASFIATFLPLMKPFSAANIPFMQTWAVMYTVSFISVEFLHILGFALGNTEHLHLPPGLLRLLRGCHHLFHVLIQTFVPLSVYPITQTSFHGRYDIYWA